MWTYLVRTHGLYCNLPHYCIIYRPFWSWGQNLNFIAWFWSSYQIRLLDGPREVVPIGKSWLWVACSCLHDNIDEKTLTKGLKDIYSWSLSDWTGLSPEFLVLQNYGMSKTAFLTSKVLVLCNVIVLREAYNLDLIRSKYAPPSTRSTPLCFFYSFRSHSLFNILSQD